MLGIIIGGLVVAAAIGLIYWLSNQPAGEVFSDEEIVEETTTTTTIITEERYEERH